jgi:hypothetical protein
MLPECLTNTIGVTPCEPPEVNVQLHNISELEGLSLSSLAATVDAGKFASARKEIESLVPIGISKTLFRLKNLFAQRGANMHREIDTGEFCFFNATKQAALTAGDQGLQIQRNNVLQPQVQPIRVNWVTLKSPNLTVDIPLKIKNDAGVVLWETTVATLPANTEMQIMVGVDFYVNKVLIVVEGSAMQGFYASCHKGQACCGGELGYSNLNSIQPTAFYVNGIEGGVVGGFKSPGITANVTLPCLDSLFCQFREELAPAFLYDTGVCILKEWQASTRLNVYALKKEWVVAKIPEWEQEAVSKTEAVLPLIYDKMLRCFPRCFECKQTVGFMAALP